MGAIFVGPWQSFSVFLLAFLNDFGSSRTATAAAFSIHMASYALGGCALAALVDRLGPRHDRLEYGGVGPRLACVGHTSCGTRILLVPSVRTLLPRSTRRYFPLDPAIDLE